MRTNRRTARVTADHAFPLVFTDDALGDAADADVLRGVVRSAAGETHTAAPVRTLIVLDKGLADLSPDLPTSLVDTIACAHEPVIVRGGEACKNDWSQVERLWSAINSADLDRRSVIVAVGGGAVLDLVGFAAATAHRGVRLVRMPTTTLSQGDGGVGVKNGVNRFGKKNWVGAFAAPDGVVCDAALLGTLPDRDHQAGFSEAVKVALLKDSAFFDELCAHAGAIRTRDPVRTRDAIERSAVLHLEHITTGGDPFERTAARPLDFGHWSAHKLEAMSGFRIRHGEAVSIGIALDCLYSAAMLGLPDADAERVVRCLSDLGLPVWDELLGDAGVLLDGLEEFRQHLGGRLTVTMLRAVGEPVEVHEIDHAAMSRAITKLRELSEPLPNRRG